MRSGRAGGTGTGTPPASFVHLWFLAEFCLSCGKMRAATFHPLFEGGLCQTCKVGAASRPRVACSFAEVFLMLSCVPPGRVPGDLLHVRRRRLPVLLHHLLWRARGPALWQRQLLQVTPAQRCRRCPSSVCPLHTLAPPLAGVSAWTVWISWWIPEHPTTLATWTRGDATCASRCCSMASSNGGTTGT